MSGEKAAIVRARPGTRVHVSGQYALFFPGGERYNDAEATFVKDRTFGPTPKPGLLWGLVDRTQHETDTEEPQP